MENHTVHDLIIEDRPFGANPNMKDLTRHLYTRMACGQVVIIAERPAVLISELRKQWLKLARKVQTERAKTLDARRIYELTRSHTQMLTTKFVAHWPPYEHPGKDVYVATIQELLHWAPEGECRTLYATYSITKEQLYMVTSWMPKQSLIVCCTHNLSRSLL